MALTKRDLNRVRDEDSGWFAFAKTTARFLNPLFKLLWRIGSIRRWAQNSAGGRVGAISRLAKSGRHEEAAVMAMEALGVYRQGPRDHGASSLETWWLFARLAAENLSAAADHEGMDRLIRIARSGQPPREGYPAAQTLLVLSRWTYKQKDYDAAFEFAGMASEANPTWADPNFFLGWFCLALGRGGAKEHLTKAVRAEPGIYFRIVKDPLCRQSPQITASLKQLVDETSST